MQTHALIAFGSGLLFLLIAMFCWRKTTVESPTRSRLGLFALLMSFLNALQGAILMGWGLPAGGVDFANLLIFLIGLISFAYFDLTRSFLQQASLRPGWWLAAVGLLTGQIVLEIWQPVGVVLEGVSLTTVLLGVSTALWVVFTTITIELSIRNYRTRNNPLHRNRLSYWTVTLLFALLGEGSYALNNPSFGNIFFLASAVSAAYVILTHRHPDIRLSILQILSALIMTALVGVVYTLAYLSAQFIFQVRLGTSPLIAGVAMALLLVIVFRPLFNQLQRNIEVLLGRVTEDTSSTIQEYSLSISNILNIEQLSTVSTGLISEALDTRKGLLFIVNQVPAGEQEQAFRLEAVPGGMGVTDPPPALTLSPRSPIALYLATQHRPLVQYDIDFMPLFKSVPAAERQWFSRLGMDVYLPIYSKGVWIGMLAVGPKETGVPYSEAELSLMSTLTNQTSVALENARLVEGVLQVNLQLEQANANLKKTKEELEQLDQAKSDFISIASHELRTPLTVIQGYTQMLLDDPALLENQYYKNLLEGIVNGAERLHHIVENMLDVAKIDVRELQLAPVPIPVHNIISSVCRPMAKVLEQRNLTLEIGDLSTLRPIEVDREAIQKVFYHLINNAIKYTPDGGKITVTGRMLPRDNHILAAEAVEIVVKDTGIGIDADNQALIFRKFYRSGDLGLHSSGRTKFRGAGPGLGLAIARGVVEAHGGKIWVESEGYDEKKLPGSRFFVVLPIRQISRNGKS